MNMTYCIDTIYGRIFYKNPFLEGNSYIHEIPNPHGIYIDALFVDQHPNISMFMGITIHQRD